MPAVIIYPTSTRCPICHEAFLGVIPRSHFEEEHPEYWAWNQAYSKKLLYFLPWPFLGFAAAVLLPGNSSNLQAILVFGSFLPVLVGLVPYLREIRKMRYEWKKIHPIDPPHYTPPKIVAGGLLIAVLGLVVFVLGGVFLPGNLPGYAFLAGIVLVASGCILTLYEVFFGPHRPTPETVGVVEWEARKHTLIATVPFLLGLLGAVIASAALQGQSSLVGLIGWSSYFLLWGVAEALLIRHHAYSSRRVVANRPDYSLAPPVERHFRTTTPQPVVATNDDLEWCPHCSVAIPRSSKICPHCGKPLKELGSQ